MVAGGPAFAAGPDAAFGAAERRAFIGRAVVEVGRFFVHADAQNVVDGHAHGVSGVPLHAGQDQKVVVLPGVADLAVVADRDEVVAGFPVDVDRLHRFQNPVGNRGVHVHISFIPVSSVFQNSHSCPPSITLRAPLCITLPASQHCCSARCCRSRIRSRICRIHIGHSRSVRSRNGRSHSRIRLLRRG